MPPCKYWITSPTAFPSATAPDKPLQLRPLYELLDDDDYDDDNNDDDDDDYDNFDDDENRHKNQIYGHSLLLCL